MAAFGALGEAGAQIGGGGGVAVGDVAVGNDGSAGDGADVGVGGCGACGDITADGRQAADGDHVADLWRGRTSGPRGRRLEPTTGYHEDAWRCWAAAWLQAVGEQRRRKEQHVGDGEGAASWGVMPTRKRLWLAWKRRRQRRLL